MQDVIFLLTYLYFYLRDYFRTFQSYLKPIMCYWNVWLRIT